MKDIYKFLVELIAVKKLKFSINAKYYEASIDYITVIKK